MVKENCYYCGMVLDGVDDAYYGGEEDGIVMCANCISAYRDGKNAGRGTHE